MDFAKIIAQLAPIGQYFDVSMLAHLDSIAAHTTPMYLQSGERFPPKGHEQFQAAYIAEGIFRVYSVDAKGKETTIRLSAEGDFTMYLEDYKKFNPDLEYRWEAVTNATLLTWSNESMEYLARNVPNWYSLSMKIIHVLLLRMVVERGEMFNDDATTRYLKFAQRYPSILARVPLRHVANYLGIAPQSLSRIRQQVGAQQDSSASSSS
jgi:CRP-like cAMP-binding protein